LEKGQAFPKKEKKAVSGFFIIKQGCKNNRDVWDVMEHNNRSPSEGLHVASFESREMAENYIKNYFDKDDLARDSYYKELERMQKHDT
jgi:hypothetical protein